MAGGFVYNVIETPELSTSEIYGKTLADLAKEHKEIVAVTADLATSTKLQDFTNACPDRVFNVGIAEQNMIGVAAGMARGSFPLLRPSPCLLLFVRRISCTPISAIRMSTLKS